MMVRAGAVRTSLPSTLTWSCAPGCALKFVQILPLTVTRPAAINPSQCRREPTPAAARKRFKRKGATKVTSLGSDVRLRLWQADDFTIFFPLAALLQKLDALEAFQHVSPGGDGACTF